MKLLKLIVFGAVVCTACSIYADKTLKYENIEVNATVNRDYSVDVREDQHVVLNGKWNGLFRSFKEFGDRIAVKNIYGNGKAYRRGDISEKGSYTVERIAPDGETMVKWRSRNVTDPAYNMENTVFRIDYRVDGAVKHSALHWRPIITTRTFPIQNVCVRINFLAPVKDCKVEFSGGGRKSYWTQSPDKKTFYFYGSNLRSNDMFDIKITFPSGADAVLPAKGVSNIQGYKPYLIPGCIGVTLVLLFMIWLLFGKDPVPRGCDFRPDMDKLPPGLLGIAIDESFDMHDLCATFLDLARRKIISITQIEEQTTGSPAQFRIKLLSMEDKAGLRRFERKTLENLFPEMTPGSSAVLFGLNDEQRVDFKEIKAAAWKDVSDMGWFALTPPVTCRIFGVVGGLIVTAGVAMAAWTYPMVGTILAIGVGVCATIIITMIKAFNSRAIVTFMEIIIFVLAAALGTVTLIFTLKSSDLTFDFGVAMISCGLLIILSGKFMARKTPLGVEAANFGKSLKKRFEAELEGPEADEVSLDEMLPWAVALGGMQWVFCAFGMVRAAMIPYLDSNSSFFDIYALTDFYDPSMPEVGRFDSTGMPSSFSRGPRRINSFGSRGGFSGSGGGW